MGGRITPANLPFNMWWHRVLHWIDVRVLATHWLWGERAIHHRVNRMDQSIGDAP